MALSKSSFALITVSAVFVAAIAVAVAMYNSPAAPDSRAATAPVNTPAGDTGQQPDATPVARPPVSPTAAPAARVARQQVGARGVATAPAAKPVEIAPRQPGAAPEAEAPSSSPVTSTPVAEALAPLGNRLVTVFHFVAATETWVYYDPEFPDEGALKAMASGQEYLILVTESITVEVNGQPLELVCSNDDCWNTVVWP